MPPDAANPDATPGRLSSLDLLLLTGFMVAGAVARLHGLGAYFLSPDEATIMVIARADTVGAVWREAFTQAHPPLHFLLLHFWPNPGNSVMWLRWSSLLPGLLTIPVFFLLGRRPLGRTGGLILALLAAGSAGPVLASQVIRPYAWALPLLAGAGAAWFDFMDRGRTRSALLYSGLMLAALAVHYSAALAIAGFGAAGLGMLLMSRRPRDAVTWTAVHAPLLAAGAAFYHFHLARIADQRTGWMEGYLQAGFAGSAAEFGRHLLSLFDLFGFASVAPAFAALAALGLVVLVRQRNWATLFLVGGFFLAGVVPNLLGKYPLHGSRHSLWIFPALALPVAAGMMEVGRLVAGLKSARTLPPGGHPRWLQPLLYFAAAFLFAAVYAMPGLPPGYRQAREQELPVTQSLFRWTQEFMQTRTRPDDTILTTTEMAIYLKFVAGRKAETAVSPRLSRITDHGRDFFFLPESWLLTSERTIVTALREIDAARPIAPESTVWVFNLGWGNRRFRAAFDSLFQARLASAETVEQKYLLIYRLPGSAVRATLAAAGDTPPAGAEAGATPAGPLE